MDLKLAKKIAGEKRGAVTKIGKMLRGDYRPFYRTLREGSISFREFRDFCGHAGCRIIIHNEQTNKKIIINTKPNQDGK